MTHHHPQEIYTQQLVVLIKNLSALNKKKRQLTWLRLISFLSAVAALWIISSLSWLLAISVFIILICLFIFFASEDQINSQAIQNTLLLIGINEREIAALQHQFTDFPDGSEWKPHNHPYANDLDIFGRASLYQYMNRTTSQQGNQLMADWLLQPASAGIIEKRKEAVMELSGLFDWRQQLQAYGILNNLTIKTEKNIRAWLSEKNQYLNHTTWQLFRIVFPILSFTVFGLFLFDVIRQNRFLPLMLLFLVIAYSVSKKIVPVYTQLNKITGELETLSDSINWIEKKIFTSSRLQDLTAVYQHSGSIASESIKQLKKLLDRLDYRLNPVVHIPLSAFLCWDLQQIFALEKWKSANKENINQWISSLAEIEALSTLSNLSFNHPGWCFPEFVSGEVVLKTEKMGHPLIPVSSRVNNSFSTEGVNQVTLITGSNMAGKSTFLRCAGVNIVLAMMGSAVCASQFSLSPMKVMSSMRISDNLEESTSTFYAELKKLKEIIEAVYNNEKVFLLLDEILRGTNSADRHTGSTALLKQLIKHQATGMVATHDLELAKLADEFPEHIYNYHFDVQVADEELYFDYKLKRGICQSMNASILMKKIGIEL